MQMLHLNCKLENVLMLHWQT